MVKAPSLLESIQDLTSQLGYSQILKLQAAMEVVGN